MHHLTLHHPFPKPRSSAVLQASSTRTHTETVPLRLDYILPALDRQILYPLQMVNKVKVQRVRQRHTLGSGEPKTTRKSRSILRSSRTYAVHVQLKN